MASVEPTEDATHGNDGLLWFLAGIAAGALAVILAIASIGSGHGDYVAARIFFPYSLLLTMPLETNSLPIILALVQFPLYGALMGLASSRRRSEGVGAILALLHVAAIVATFYLMEGGDF